MRRLGFGLVLALTGLGGCADPVNGELVLEHVDGRSLVYAPTQCHDGNQRGYFGTELRDEDDRILEFRRSGSEPTLSYYAPGIGAFEVDPSLCERFEGELMRRFNRVTDNGYTYGDLTVECESAGGWRIAGTVSFDDCGPPPSDDDSC